MRRRHSLHCRHVEQRGRRCPTIRRLKHCVSTRRGCTAACCWAPAWSWPPGPNCNDRVTQESADHHTLSLYVADGYECYQQVPGGWRNGGGPDRFCIMPRQYASTWDVRSDLSFVHLYCTDGHLRQLAEQTWDRSPAAISVEPRSFGEDPQITLLYRQFCSTATGGTAPICWRSAARLTC